jgi:hypothetical protein
MYSYSTRCKNSTKQTNKNNDLIFRSSSIENVSITSTTTTTTTAFAACIWMDATCFYGLSRNGTASASATSTATAAASSTVSSATTSAWIWHGGAHRADCGGVSQV